MNSKDSLIQQQNELLNYASSKTSYSVDKIAEKYEFVYILFSKHTPKYRGSHKDSFLALVQKHSKMPHVFYLKDGKKRYDCVPIEYLSITPINNGDDQSLLDML